MEITQRQFLLVCAFLVAVTVTDVVRAQGRYYPSRPTFSPWLYLYRGESGPLDPYNAWVRPQFEYQDTLRAIENRFRQQERSVNQLRRENTLLRESLLSPTGVPSRFMDYSHFYGGAGGSTTRRPTSTRLEIGTRFRAPSVADHYKRAW